jgi:hypothetical protein
LGENKIADCISPPLLGSVFTLLFDWVEIGEPFLEGFEIEPNSILDGIPPICGVHPGRRVKREIGFFNFFGYL